jgi:polyphosphate glucokinase
MHNSTKLNQGPTSPGLVTLGIDIGGTNLKAAVLDAEGQFLSDRILEPTPRPATPRALMDAIGTMVVGLPAFHRASIGFPGVVRSGVVVTAPNLGTAQWSGMDLAARLANKLNVPVRMLNDAAMHGLGVAKGPGLECVITLGTGVGCAVFRSGRFLLHLELGQLARGNVSYDGFIGQAAMVGVGLTEWNQRVHETVETVISLTSCETLYIGGGNSRHLAEPYPVRSRIVGNRAGLGGAVRMWDSALDELFVGEPHALPSTTDTPLAAG